MVSMNRNLQGANNSFLKTASFQVQNQKIEKQPTKVNDQPAGPEGRHWPHGSDPNDINKNGDVGDTYWDGDRLMIIKGIIWIDNSDGSRTRGGIHVEPAG